jgi:hypothetical protein
MGAGILAGQVGSVFEFLRPREGNSFVLAWWALQGALLALATGWVLVGGGAELLERHPGVYGLPEWPARKLRLYWLAAAAGSLAIGALFVLGFPGEPTGRGRAPSLPSWLPALFPVLFVGLWLLVSFTLSAMGGWRALAEHYPAPSSVSGRRFRWRSGRMAGGVNYGGCLTLGAAPGGLYLAVLPMFRAGHPPLLIPWSDVTAREARTWLAEHVELQFARVPRATLRISRRLATPLLEASQPPVRVQPSAS